MKMIYKLVTICWLLMVAGLGSLSTAHASSVTSLSAVPDLQELGGDWLDVASTRSMPCISNRHGAAQATRNVLSVGNLSFPPLTLYATTGDLAIDGTSVDADSAQWLPYQVSRKGHSRDIEVDTAVKMPLKGNALLFNIVLTNDGTDARNFKLTIALTSSIAIHKNWGWDIPRDDTTGRITSLQDVRSLDIVETTGLCTSFYFTSMDASIAPSINSGIATFNLTLAPNQSTTVDYVETFGANQNVSDTSALAYADNFSASWNGQKSDWQAWFEQEFTPRNNYFSGSLPMLVTSDAAMRRVYYMSALSALLVCRDSYPIAPRVYVSNAPQDNSIMVYFWDTREWATELTLLDPAMIKMYLEGWLSKGIYGGYAEEFLTGSLQGPWYSANDISIFIQLDTYVNVTGDRAFLQQQIDGETVLQHMYDIAVNWKRLVKPGQTLADYGTAWNLLECVPTYIDQVASFNAADVYMMRRMAVIETAEGNTAAAASLTADSGSLLPAVLSLYEPGQGVWDCIHADGTKVQVRHVFDFATVGQSIPSDLTPQTKLEMVNFVERELITDHWMRAQSLSDSAAADSDRPDHGPMGAFAAWPPETMSTMIEFGAYPQALDFMHRIEAVTYEGPFSQSHELMGKSHDSPVKIAERGWQTYYVSSGAALADTVIREFFGYQPDIFMHSMIHDKNPRGFDGELLNVRQGSRYYDITSSDRGISVGPAQK